MHLPHPPPPTVHSVPLLRSKAVCKVSHIPVKMADRCLSLSTNSQLALYCRVSAILVRGTVLAVLQSSIGWLVWNGVCRLQALTLTAPLVASSAYVMIAKIQHHMQCTQSLLLCPPFTFMRLCLPDLSRLHTTAVRRY